MGLSKNYFRWKVRGLCRNLGYCLFQSVLVLHKFTPINRTFKIFFHHYSFFKASIGSLLQDDLLDCDIVIQSQFKKEKRSTDQITTVQITTGINHLLCLLKSNDRSHQCPKNCPNIEDRLFHNYLST
jgi:hypothetical protein